MCSTLARMHMNGRLWVNDPDCLIIRKEVRESPEEAEWLMKMENPMDRNKKTSDKFTHGLDYGRVEFEFSTACS